MKKTFNVDAQLLRDARAACGASTDTETLRLGLKALVQQAAYRALAAYRGSETEVVDVPRRREEPAPKRKPLKRKAA